jgi:hypothetical protein
MKIKYDVDEQRVVITFREEPLLYFDANHEEVPFACFYSQNGDLAEIRFYESELRKELKEQKGPENRAFTISENLPRRKYIYQYSTAHPYWGCIDSYNDIRSSDDWFMWTGSLAITRRDHKKMNRKEIRDIREDVFEDFRQWLDKDCPGSIYYKKALYFWRSDEMGPTWPHSEESFKDFIRKYAYDPLSEFLEIQERSLGFDALICDDSGDEVTAYVCISGLWGEEDYQEIVIGEQELIQILSQTSEISNRIIVPLNHIVFSEAAVRHIENHSIRIMHLDDFRKKEFLSYSDFLDGAIRDGDIDPADYSEIFRAFTIP